MSNRYEAIGHKNSQIVYPNRNFGIDNTQEIGISLFKRFYDAFKHMNDRMTCCGTQVEPPGTISWSSDIAMEAMALSVR